MMKMLAALFDSVNVSNYTPQPITTIETYSFQCMTSSACAPNFIVTFLTYCIGACWHYNGEIPNIKAFIVMSPVEWGCRYVHLKCRMAIIYTTANRCCSWPIEMLRNYVFLDSVTILTSQLSEMLSSDVTIWAVHLKIMKQLQRAWAFRTSETSDSVQAMFVKYHYC